ncbi:MAG: hypothetical protein QXH97_00310 [Candidatus Bathyarchaeia archaeon]
MIRIVETVTIILIIGAIVLVGLHVIKFQDSLTLISLAIGLLGGKHLTRVERALWRNWRVTEFMKTLENSVTAISFDKNIATIYVLPDFMNIAEEIEKIAQRYFPEYVIKIEKGERIRFV